MCRIAIQLDISASMLPQTSEDGLLCAALCKLSNCLCPTHQRESVADLQHGAAMRVDDIAISPDQDDHHPLRQLQFLDRAASQVVGSQAYLGDVVFVLQIGKQRRNARIEQQVL
jgi:hypothetical protein